MDVKLTTSAPGQDPIYQFSIYADNKAGRLNDLLTRLSDHNVHLVAITTLDTTDSAMIRILVDDLKRTRSLLKERAFCFNETEVVAVEIDSQDSLRNITNALVQAEININYIYPFMRRPEGKVGLVIRLEDNDLAADVLAQNQIKVLTQGDIAR